ncbi:hypothetical protein D8674_016658 [Pyrus ussuriensis x Pyrus communis]|uniref:Uncharacterized protein n=1 Tax=Pyrus ussuriensis x Pyrus communis TaxID=2448454 RepID=A0A5N5HBK0_9ROSA|nr:hypothetical protein D8674_016658 [Pyrus ussuriensis x Pyrus communis]
MGGSLPEVLGGALIGSNKRFSQLPGESHYVACPMSWFCFRCSSCCRHTPAIVDSVAAAAATIVDAAAAIATRGGGGGQAS